MRGRLVEGYMKWYVDEMLINKWMGEQVVVRSWVVNGWQMEDRRMGRWVSRVMGEKMKDAWMERWANWWVHQHRGTNG